jgi:hypothetical protein
VGGGYYLLSAIYIYIYIHVANNRYNMHVFARSVPFVSLKFGEKVVVPLPCKRSLPRPHFELVDRKKVPSLSL